MMRMRRAIALLLAAALVFNVCPASAIASMYSTEPPVTEITDTHQEQESVEAVIEPVDEPAESYEPAAEEKWYISI